MKLLIEIDLDNAIFEDEGAAEVERLLLSVASRIPDPPAQTAGRYSLHEANGNYCGHFEIAAGESLNDTTQELLDALLAVRKAFYVDGKPKALKAAFEKTTPLVRKLQPVS